MFKGWRACPGKTKGNISSLKKSQRNCRGWQQSKSVMCRTKKNKKSQQQLFCCANKKRFSTRCDLVPANPSCLHGMKPGKGFFFFWYQCLVSAWLPGLGLGLSRGWCQQPTSHGKGRKNAEKVKKIKGFMHSLMANPTEFYAGRSSSGCRPPQGPAPPVPSTSPFVPGGDTASVGAAPRLPSGEQEL